MDYDPIKDRLGTLFTRTVAGQRLFYRLLDAVFLRSWYVRREIERIVGSQTKERPLQVLDAGTGFGQYAYHMAKTYPLAVIDAVDVKDDYLDNARRFIVRTPYAERVQFRKADLTQLDAEGAYDLILAVDVMEHIEEDERVLARFSRALRPGGHVIINTPSDLGGSDAKVDGEPGFIGEHVREGYNRVELEEKLRRAGLQPVRTLYTYGSAGSAAWRLLVKYPMKMLGVSNAALFVLPIYYLPVFPIGMVLHALDLRVRHSRGTGLIAVASKQ